MTNQIINLHTPKYVSIAEEIMEKINSGMNVGERIYSEKEIMDKYGVSSTTARKSLEVLRHGNIVERIQGKGTFVINKKVFRSLRKIISYTENMKKQGIVPSTKVIEKKILTKYTEYHKKLQLSPGDSVLKLKRVKYGDGIPLVVDCRYISLKHCPDIYKKDFNISLYELYEQYNIKIAHSKQYLELSLLNETDAKLLNCKKGDPVIHMEGMLSLEDFTPVEYENAQWNGVICGFQFEASL
jgi:GntR family transcriptional regulator